MRRDFVGREARTRGDTWAITLPFASGLIVPGTEVAMVLRRYFAEATPGYGAITNETDAVLVSEDARTVVFTFPRALTKLIDAKHIWYDAKLITSTTRLTPWYGEIEVLPTGVSPLLP